MGVVLSRKTGAGAPPGAGSPQPASRRQDRRLPPGEGRERRRMGAHDLYACGLTGLETICVDGGQGLAGGPRLPRHPGPALPGAQDVSSTRRSIRTPSGRISTLPPTTAPRPGAPPTASPHAGRCIPQGRRMPARRSRRSADLLPGPRPTQTGQHAIERREGRPLGAFETSMDRILILIHENIQQGISTHIIRDITPAVELNAPLRLLPPTAKSFGYRPDQPELG